ncbi:MAG: choline kinase family protein [Gammaproteobacteria bacterium]|nr:choline kinase family protein [Gammaproteobacteria bacterium]MDH3464775.1 choline kinase family protein [Gammaproteobacteria bacterium]
MNIEEHEEQKRQRKAREVAAREIGGGNVDPESLPIEPIAGMTNRNYLVTIGDKKYVVRIPGHGTEEYVDRVADEQAARITAHIGVGAPLPFYDVKAGIQITEFIHGSIDMRTPGVLDDPEALRRAARAFHKLHTSGKKFLNLFDEKNVAQEYIELLRQKDARLPDGYEKIQEEAEAIRKVLAETCKELVPCHNDPAPENLVDTGERVYILDWEFSGNNDAFWDLGDFSVESGLTDEQDYIFLEAYCGRKPTEAEIGRMVLQKALVFLLWTLWGILQEANKNPRPAYEFASYWDYAMDRFTRCQEIMNGEDFPRYMETVRKS